MPFDFRLPANFHLHLALFLGHTSLAVEVLKSLFVCHKWNDAWDEVKTEATLATGLATRQLAERERDREGERVGKPTNCKLTSAKVMKSQQKRRTTFLEKWKATKLQTQLKSSTNSPKGAGNSRVREKQFGSCVGQRETDREGEREREWDRDYVKRDQSCFWLPFS